MDSYENQTEDINKILLYKQAIKLLDSFIGIIYEVAGYSNVDEEEKINYDTMAEIANAMQVQLFEQLSQPDRDNFINDLDDY